MLPGRNASKQHGILSLISYSEKNELPKEGEDYQMTEYLQDLSNIIK